MSSDFEYFKNYIIGLKLSPSDEIFSLIKTNSYNASVYKFKVDNENNVFLISYNDSIIKSKQSGNMGIINLLNNPLYPLLFTNSYFNPKSFNESMNILDLYMDNFKNFLKYKEIINVQTKEIYKLSDADVRFIENTLGDNYDTIVNDLFENNVYIYTFMSLFFGIYINYWYINPSRIWSISHKKLEVVEYIYKKMNVDISTIKNFNILDYFYIDSGKTYSYTYFLTMKITDNLKNYYIECD